VDRDGADTGSPGDGDALTGARLTTTPGHESLSARVEDREGKMENPSCCSPERGGRRGGQVIVVN
jgi:hypothetical protein